MIRLFLKLYGVLIATLVLSFVVQMQLMQYVWNEMSSGFDFRVRFRPTFHLLEESLAAVAPARWQDEFARVAAGLTLPARMTPLETLPERQRFKPGDAATLERGGIVALDREEGGFTLVKRLRDSGHAAAIDFPGPDNRKVKFITYAVNWAVEFAIVAVLVFFWVRPFWRDVTGLRQAAEEVGAGRFEARAQVGRHSALAPLAEAFNAMTRRVGSLIQSHRTLTSAVSHELRTPLARLRFTHSLAREEPTAPAKDRFLARMEGDIVEIDELTAELLDYARLERGTPAIRMESVPAEPWLEDLLADARDDRARTSGAVEIRPEVELETLRCEPRYMSRAVRNLMRNALTHARSRVTISLRHEHGRTVIRVDDDGPGIPQADRERLFEPFERLDRSRTRDSGGFGLGLAIVRQVARWHGGEASIGASPLGGARVSIAW